MNEKMRKALGFLGLVEDDYNEYAATEAPRPFSEEAPEQWSPPARGPARPVAPAPARVVPAAPARVPGTSGLRPQAAPGVIRPQSAPVFETPTPRPRPAVNPTPVGRWGQESDVAVEVLTPREFNECQRITDQLRLNRIVILVVTECGPAVARRLVDFAAGTAYALRSTMETLEKGAVYAVYPSGAVLTPEVRARLAASNYTSATFS